MKVKVSGHFTKYFSEAVKRLRKERGLSHEKLAALAGITRTTVANIESGKKSPTLNTCYKIAVALQIRLSELIKNAE